MSRKSDFSLRVSKILDKQEAISDAKELAKELQSILSFEVDADTFKRVGDIFNKKLTEIGRTPIDFSDIRIDDKALEAMASRFTSVIADAVSDGLKAGVSGGTIGGNEKLMASLKAEQSELKKQLDLMKKKEESIRRMHALYRETTDLGDKRFVEIEKNADGKHTSSKDYHNYQWKNRGNIDSMHNEIEQVELKVQDVMSEIENIMLQASSLKDVNKAKLTGKLMEVADLLTTLKDMQASFEGFDFATSEKLKNRLNNASITQITTFSQTLQEKYDDYEMVEDLFPKTLKGLGVDYSKPYETPAAISEKINAKTTRLDEVAAELKDLEKQANSTVKSIDDVNAAIDKRYQEGKKKPIPQAEITRADKITKGHIQPEATLSKLAQAYDDAVAGEDWVEQYEALLQFTSLYQKLESEGKNVQKYGELFGQLSPYIDVAKASLEEFVNKANEVNAGKLKTDIAKTPTTQQEPVVGGDAGESERVAQANKESADAAEREKQARESAAKAEKEKLEATEKTLNLLRSMSSVTGSSSNEQMSLMGASGTISTVGGDEYAVDTNKLVSQLIDNLKNNILMSLHNHPDGMLAFTPSDIMSYGGLFKDQGIDFHGIIADGVIKTIDFTGVSKEVILQVARSFSEQLQEKARNSDGLFNYKDGELILSDDVKSLATTPEGYDAIRTELIGVIDSALNNALEANGVQSVVRSFNTEQLPQLAEHLLQIQNNAQATIEPVEKLKKLMPFIYSTKNVSEINDAGELELLLTKRKEVFEALQKEDLLTDEIRASYDAGNKEIEERISLLRQANNISDAGNAIVPADTDTGNALSDARVKALEDENKAQQDRIEQLQREAADAEYRNQQVRGELYQQIEDANLEKDKALAAAAQKDATIKNLQEQLAKVKTAPVSGGTIGIDATEINNLEKLEDKLKEVISKVEAKTQAFKLEGQVVGQVVGKEISGLMKLEQHVDGVNAKVLELVGNLKNVKTATPSAPVPQQPTQKQPTPSDNKQPDDKKEKESDAVKNLIKLYTEYGKLKEEAGAVTGENLAAHLKSQVDVKLREIEEIRRSLKEITPEMEKKFTDAMNAGATKEADKQYRKLANSEDKAFDKEYKKLVKDDEKDEISRLTKIRSIEADIGKLRADSDNATDEGVKNALKKEIEFREEIIAKQKEGLELDAETEQYWKRRLANETKEAKAAAAQDKRDSKARLLDQIKTSRGKANVTKATSVNNKGNAVLAEAVAIDGLTEKDIAMLTKYNSELEELDKTLAEVNDHANGVVSPEQQQKLIQQTGNVDKHTKEVEELVEQYKRLSGENVQELGVNTLGSSASLSDYKKQLIEMVMAATNGKAHIKGFDNATKTLSYTVNDGAHEFTEYKAELRQLGQTFVTVQGETKRTETFFESLTRKTKEISTYLISSVSLYDVINKVKQGIQYVREIDSALTELKKVTEGTTQEYERFLDTASKTGARIGSTIVDFTNASATFAKLGYDMKTSATMAEAALIYQNVGDGVESADAAAESIISTMKGFGLEASEAMAIVDRFNKVGKLKCPNYIVICNSADNYNG